MKEEKKSKDKESFIEICAQMGVTMPQGKVIECKRIGDPKERKEDDKPRPLIVSMDDDKMKAKIFKNAFKLKKTLYSRISIQNDLTKRQRDNEARLRAEANRRNQALPLETKVWRVVGPPWDRDLALKNKRLISNKGEQSILQAQAQESQPPPGATAEDHNMTKPAS